MFFIVIYIYIFWEKRHQCLISVDINGRVVLRVERPEFHNVTLLGNATLEALPFNPKTFIENREHFNTYPLTPPVAPSYQDLPCIVLPITPLFECLFI